MSGPQSASMWGGNIDIAVGDRVESRRAGQWWWVISVPNPVIANPSVDGVAVLVLQNGGYVALKRLCNTEAAALVLNNTFWAWRRADWRGPRMAPGAFGLLAAGGEPRTWVPPNHPSACAPIGHAAAVLVAGASDFAGVGPGMVVVADILAVVHSFQCDAFTGGAARGGWPCSLAAASRTHRLVALLLTTLYGAPLRTTADALLQLRRRADALDWLAREADFGYLAREAEVRSRSTRAAERLWVSSANPAPHPPPPPCSGARAVGAGARLACPLGGRLREHRYRPLVGSGACGACVCGDAAPAA